MVTRSSKPAEGYKRVHWRVYTGFIGGRVEGWFDVENDTPEEDIDPMVEHEVFQRISYSWYTDEDGFSD